ncbi:Sua5/YciO/YrdC/YwlC family protein [Streptomyces sp. NBC_01232]|uniref:L-threonylcarbamoyladenylate synthase n=1 Tax=Streptomyces sp. NBC_01232 TaxID=2903786 RepID=UPI002E0FDF4A|nr:Sua5/YciO/YrdC/YwlC family protein [Streptomyces sp. NBC_01232]
MAVRFDCSTASGRGDGLREAASAVRRGDLVVLPTDTVYGIGADAFDRDAVERLLNAKGRDRAMPSPVLVASPEALHDLVTGFPDSTDSEAAPLPGHCVNGTRLVRRSREWRGVMCPLWDGVPGQQSRHGAVIMWLPRQPPPIWRARVRPGSRFDRGQYHRAAPSFRVGVVSPASGTGGTCSPVGPIAGGPAAAGAGRAGGHKDGRCGRRSSSRRRRPSTGHGRRR